MPTPYLIFDLDGTLFDSSLDLANSVNYALQEFQLPTHDLATVISFIGNGALNLIRKASGEAGAHAVRDIHQVFLAHYLEHCTQTIQPYPGMHDLLAHPFRASLLTNKPDAPTRKILHHFGLHNRFEYVLCGDTAPERKPSPAGILHILQNAQVPPENALMVGDDLPDLGCARAAGVRSAILLHGFGNNSSLLAAQPDLVCADFAEFSNLLTL